MHNQPLKLSDLIALQAENAKAPQHLKPVTKIKPLEQLQLPNVPQPKGGKRSGAGRKKTAEETTVVRVPLGCLAAVQQLIAEYKNPRLKSVTEIKTRSRKAEKQELWWYYPPYRSPLTYQTPDGSILPARYAIRCVAPADGEWGYQQKTTVGNNDDCYKLWSGKGRMPREFDDYVANARTRGKDRSEALAEIDAMMLEQRFVWWNASSGGKPG